MESKWNKYGVKPETNLSQTRIRMISLFGAFTPGLLQDYSRITQDYSRIYSRITLGLLYKITIFDLSNICKMILLKKSEIVLISVRCLFFGGP